MKPALIAGAAPLAAASRESSQSVGKAFNFGIGRSQKPAEETNR
jgi:hypothetical protein